MNKNQRTVIIISILIIIIMGLFPPWIIKIKSSTMSAEIFQGYSFYFAPEMPPAAQLDLNRIIFQLLIIIILSLGIFMILGKVNKTSEADNDQVKKDIASSERNITEQQIYITLLLKDSLEYVLENIYFEQPDENAEEKELRKWFESTFDIAQRSLVNHKQIYILLSRIQMHPLYNNISLINSGFVDNVNKWLEQHTDIIKYL